MDRLEPADAVLLAVAHALFRSDGWSLVSRLLRNEGGDVLDVKGVLDRSSTPSQSAYRGCESCMMTRRSHRGSVVLRRGPDAAALTHERWKHNG